MNMDHDYARQKLETLLRDVNSYTGEEFWRQMSRIAGGATGTSHAEELQAERDKAERRAERESVAFRGMCEAFQRLEEIVGLDTGGGMGPGPALNTVQSIINQRGALAAFANEAFDAAFDGCDLDGAWIQERGAELGLIEGVEYDPEKHQIDCDVVEPGETIYVRKAWLGTKSKEAGE